MRSNAAAFVLTVSVLLCLQVQLQGQETWRRTDPDSAIYLPRGQDDRCNQQVNAVLTPRGTFVVVWTMASVEGRLDQRVVVSRSRDRGRTWSRPKVLDGQENGNGLLATYGFPFLTPGTGRIYVFYAKNTGQNSVRADITGVCRYKYSDDDGITWQDGETVGMGRGEFSHASPEADPNWIGIYSPIVTSRGAVLAGFARYKAGPDLHKGIPYSQWETEVCFLRFDNILSQRDPHNLRVTVLPESPRGLRVKRTAQMDWCNEPALIELSDGRLFVVLRTRTGYAYYAHSGDEGKTWTQPAPLCYTNRGRRIFNPNAPMILRRTAAGKILLLHYINVKNQGTFGKRDPIYLAVGRETLGRKQPVEFGQSQLFMTVHDERPPEGTTNAQIASYSSLLEHQDRLYLFYNDSKCYVLFKDVTDVIEKLEGMDDLPQERNCDAAAF